MNSPSIYKSAAGEQTVMALYDELLAGWPIPYQERYLATRHGHTFVIASGPEGAPPLVLLHGAGSNSTIWAGDAAVYGRRYRVYAVDLPGEPGKSAPNRPEWDGPAFAEWLADVYDGLGLAQATLLGISQGGWTALRFAAAYPERVTALVLLSPGGVTADRASFLLKAVPLTLLGQWGARRMVRMMFGRQQVPDGAEDIAVQVTAHFKPRVGTLPLFSDDELRRLTMPTLLLGGDEDVIRDVAGIAARLQRLLPRLSVVMVPGGGHALLDTTGLVLPFLTDNAPVRAATA
jgi:pimeloyl-ACP methyl ester carboxylesterase